MSSALYRQADVFNNQILAFKFRDALISKVNRMCAVEKALGPITELLSLMEWRPLSPSGLLLLLSSKAGCEELLPHIAMVGHDDRLMFACAP